MVSRRSLIAAISTTGAVGVTGCLSDDSNEVTSEDLDPIVVIGSPVNVDGETYEVTVNGAPNRAEYVDIEHAGEHVYTLREELQDPVTVVERAEKGELTRAIAVEGDTKEIIEEREVA